MALTTLSTLKVYLVVADNARDTILTQILAEVERAVKRHCNDNLEAADYIEDYDGWGQDQLILRHRPLNSVAYIREDAARAFPSSSVIDTSFYAFDASADNAGMIQFDGYAVSQGVRSLRVSYNAGYAANSIPEDLVMAVHKWAGAIFNKRRSDGITNESLGNESHSFEGGEMPEDVKKLLRFYRNVVAVA